jgi:hypothetical protein
MTRLALVNRIPRQYDTAAMQEVIRQIEQQANALAEGSITARHAAMTSFPTTGSAARGDIVWNSTPSDTGFIGWVCTVSGSPGTWVGFGAVGAAAATQADQETGTSTSVFVTPGRQQFHPSAAKAWWNFNGTGTIALRASYNVASLTDNGVGDYTIVFTTVLSSANYAVAYTGANGGNAIVSDAAAASSLLAGGARQVTRQCTTGTLTDADLVSGVVYGDQ